MSDSQRIDPVLVEKATKAVERGIRDRPFFAALFPNAVTCRRAAELAAEDAVRVVVDELGLKEEGVPRNVQWAYLTNPEFHANVEQARQETEREVSHPVSTEQVLLGWFGRPVEGDR